MVLDNKLRRKKGQVMILISLALVVLIGIAALVIDVGMLYLEKVALQNAVDAAVLAGGQELPANPGTAITIANDYASPDKNGKLGDEVTPIVKDEVTPTVTNANYILTVSARRHVPLYFAKIFGKSTSDVTATASATVSTVGGVSGAIPVGIEKKDAFEYGRIYTLKYGGGDGYTGNYGGLELSNNGGNDFRDNLENGYSGVLTVGQWVYTEPGGMTGPTGQGINDRIRDDSTATFATVEKGSPRIVIVPIIESMNVNGRELVQIVGFAVFFLESSHRGEITGRFMEMVIGNSTSGSGTNYGAYKLRLTQ